MASLGNRIVVLIDMDCFFCQVETRLQPEYTGKPLAVVQYNQWKLGGIIAVNYEARDFGVTRHMRGEEAKEKCPDLLLASVPCLRGKADTSRYRSAGREVIDVLKKNCNIVERASVDEAYLDITQIVDDKLSKTLIEPEEIVKQLQNTYLVGYSDCGTNDEEQRSKGVEAWISDFSEDSQIQRLAFAGAFVEDLRKQVFDTTGFRCSAGISFNKILAKLACGLHKPNRQTILPATAVPELFATLPVKKVRNLGGKLGDIVTESLKCNVMGDLLRYSLQYLQQRFDDKTGFWLYNIARGIDSEPVTPRLVSKSIGACKKFPGKQAIVDMEVLKHWLGELSAEVCERLEQDLEENERRATLLTVSFQYYQNKNSVSQSRSCALTSYKQEKVANQCFNIVIKATQPHPISFLGISTGKFIKAKGSENFMNFFKSTTSDKCNLEINNTDITNTKLEVETEKFINEKKSEVNEDNDKITLDSKTDNEKSFMPSTSNVSVNRRSSPCSSIQNSLKTDNFKKSFFMNILKDKKLTNENSEIVKNLDEHYLEIDDTNITKNDSSYSDTSNSSILECENEESSCRNEASVGLQEIFPDLNDIDPNVVKLLPDHLQQEAKKFLKTINTDERNIDVNKLKFKDTIKSTKVKASKTKSSNQNKNIQNFFIKTDVNNDTDNNLRKCTQCDQLILIQKFNEHNDYHVAQNLQEQMNRTINNEDIRKRKVMLDNPNHIKKRFSDEMVDNLQNTKPISSFFQQ